MRLIFDLYPADLYLLFDILWTESVNRKDRGRFCIILCLFHLLLFVFCHHFRRLSKNEVSITFGLWRTYLRANLLALTTDGFVRHLYMGSTTCRHVHSILTSRYCSHCSAIVLLLSERPRIQIYPAVELVIKVNRFSYGREH